MKYIRIKIKSLYARHILRKNKRKSRVRSSSNDTGKCISVLLNLYHYQMHLSDRDHFTHNVG